MNTNDQMGEFISLEEASEMTARYRNSIQPGETIAYAISKDYIARILEQNDCEGLRIYYGINNLGETTLVVTGINENKDDMYTGLIADGMVICPVDCGIISPLNS
jgi:hypothetical protein